jgi:hypothetical protein
MFMKRRLATIFLSIVFSGCVSPNEGLPESASASASSLRPPIVDCLDVPADETISIEPTTKGGAYGAGSPSVYGTTLCGDWVVDLVFRPNVSYSALTLKGDGSGWFASQAECATVVYGATVYGYDAGGNTAKLYDAPHVKASWHPDNGGCWLPQARLALINQAGPVPWTKVRVVSGMRANGNKQQLVGLYVGP